jgi:hypothetical protein
MSWFQLDPSTLACRTLSDGNDASVPTLGESIGRGIVGFLATSAAGVAPQALAGAWLKEQYGEGGLYAACALAFLMASGLVLHRLILGPGALARFYMLFGSAFLAYVVAWAGSWMLLGGHLGSGVGLLVGGVVMATMLAAAFEAWSAWRKCAVALVLLGVAGYFAGAWLVESGLPLLRLSLIRPTQVLVGKVVWAVTYGICFGAALGIAFHHCQSEARALLRPRG